MPIPKHVFDPPFNVVRSSHIALGVADLDRARAFYEGALGLIVEDEDKDALYLRALEERQHHSLVLAKSKVAEAHHLGFKVGSEGDLDKAARFFKGKGLRHAFVERPYQGRTLQAVDPFGMPMEFYFAMEKRERLLQKYDRYKGVHPLRLDHFNVLVPDVQGTTDFFATLGFRLTEYAVEEGPDGRIAAAWLHRKGNVHDLAITSQRWMMFMANAFFLYVRDPDGHRVEFYTCDYQTMDLDHEPLRWSLRDPRRQSLWGQPAPRSWFQEGSAFAGTEQREALFKANVLVAS
jgi:catechol 2,3-dioxygenase